MIKHNKVDEIAKITIYIYIYSYFASDIATVAPDLVL